jgi:zinc transport system permease protein
VVLVCLAMALVLVAMQQQRHLANDTLLGMVSHTTLALGIVAVSLQPGVRVDLFAFLFGDLLAVNWQDVAWLAGGALLILTLMMLNWRNLLSLTVDEDMARSGRRAGGGDTHSVDVVAGTVDCRGDSYGGCVVDYVLLVMPAASARRLAKTPEQMAAIAAVLGVIAVVGGLALSWQADTPVGPSIVLAAAAVFIGTLAKNSEMNHGANALAFMHQVKGLVDVFERHVVGDKGVQRDFAALRLGHITRQLGTPL